MSYKKPRLSWKIVILQKTKKIWNAFFTVEEKGQFAKPVEYATSKVRQF